MTLPNSSDAVLEPAGAEQRFDVLDEAFRLIADRGDRSVVEREILLAGRRVTFRVAGEALASSLTAPFAHLPAAPAATGTPELTIHAVDRSIHAAPRPAPAPAAGGDVLWDSPEHQVTASGDGRFVAHLIRESGSEWCLDRMENRIAGAVASTSRLTLYERGKGFQLLLPFWLRRMGLQLIHAAVVSWHGRGILVAGSNGTGKSTTALTCLAHGFGYLGDDYIALESHPDGSFSGHSIYSCAFLEPDHLERFASLRPHAIPGFYPLETKLLLLLKDVYPGRLPPVTPLHYLLLPEIEGHGPTAISPASRAEALRQLAPSCLMMAGRPEPDGLRCLARLVKGLECYRLRLGADLAAIPRQVATLVDS